jgi:DNA-binding NarL/FixJ family response regulator
MDSAMAAPVRTLLADDISYLRLLLRRALERTGEFQVVAEAANGEEAVELARHQQPDLILLNVSMPVKDGLEALPEMREISPDSTVVVLSGFEADRLSAVALAAGASAYIEKGITPLELVGELRQILKLP